MTHSRKKALIITGILFALPVLFLVEEHFRGKWALAKLKRQLVAKGEKLTVEECRPVIPEGAQNGFADFTRAATMVGGNPLYDIAPSAMRMVAAGKARVLYNLDEWPITGLNKSQQPSNSNWRLLEDALKGASNGLALAKEALRKPAFDARLNYSLRDFQIPHLAPTKRVAQYFCGDALLQLRHRRIEEALDDLEANLRLSFQMAGEPTLISQLVRIAIAAIAVGPTWQALQTPGWNDAQLERLQRAWETNDFLMPAIHALEMERAMASDMIGHMRDSGEAAALFATSMSDWAGLTGASDTNSPQSFIEVADNMGGYAKKFLVRGVYVPLWRFVWSYEDEQYYLKTMQQVLEGARSAQAVGSLEPSDRATREIEQQQQKEGAFARNRRMASGTLGISLTRYFERAAMAHAQRDLAIAAIAIKRHELRHGQPPEKLESLVPAYLSKVPRDIFDGKPLRYRLRAEGGFLLYSVGKNRKDDEGDPSPESGGSNYQFYNARDLVWPAVATPEEVAADVEKTQKREPARTSFRGARTNLPPGVVTRTNIEPPVR